MEFLKLIKISPEINLRVISYRRRSQNICQKVSRSQHTETFLNCTALIVLNLSKYFRIKIVHKYSLTTSNFFRLYCIQQVCIYLSRVFSSVDTEIQLDVRIEEPYEKAEEELVTVRKSFKIFIRLIIRQFLRHLRNALIQCKLPRSCIPMIESFKKSFNVSSFNVCSKDRKLQEIVKSKRA